MTKSNNSTSRRTPTEAGSTSKLTKVASKIRKLHNDANATELEARYEIARLVADTQADASYGDKALDLLAQELEDVGLSSKTLANYALVAKAFPKESFIKLAKRRGGTPEKPTQLTWTHLVTLAGKARHAGTLNGGNIERIVGLTLDEGLSDRQMAARWTELYEPVRSPAVQNHQDLSSGVLQMLKLIRRILDQEAAFRTDDLAKLEAGEAVPEQLLRDLVNELQALEDFASTSRERASRVLKPAVPRAASVPEALLDADEGSLPATGESEPAGKVLPLVGRTSPSASASVDGSP